ncbi:MAG: aldehyde dehydrogenase family protein, partial [Dermatophilaceae bacterium]|nr:aldehyde dehydrogenase family protein [Dermatophilaceae bacterium]
GPPGLMRGEISGREAPIPPSAGGAEANAGANATESGLVAFVSPRDLPGTLRVGEALEFGMVGINQGIVSNPAAPFGGVKHSGFGREGGFEGIEEYLEVKYLGIAP